MILLVTSLFFITLDLRGVSLISGSRSVTSTILAPFQKGASNIFAPFGRFFSDVKNFGGIKDQLATLKTENESLRLRLAYKSDIQGQLKQLQGVLDLAAKVKYKTVPGRVIGRGSTSSFSQTITIDVGSSDGISRNRTVISQNGLVGVVKSVEIHSSIVLLISDPTFRIGVRIARSQSIGVLLGQGDKTFILELLDPTGNINVGDTLITNGSDNNRPYVPGIPIGYVKSVEHTTASLTQRASVAAYSNLADIGIVSVIIGEIK